MKELNEDIGLIALHACGRSGSLFFQNLLDSHDEVLSLPSIFPFYYFWKLNKKHNKKRSVDELIEFYFQNTNLRYFFPPTDYEFYQYVDEHNKSQNYHLDASKFKSELKEVFTNNNIQFPTRKEMLVAIHLAYAKCENIDLSKTKYILLHEHYSYEFETPLEDFSNVKTIVTIRDPLNSFASFLKFREGDGIFTSINTFLSVESWVDCYVNTLNFNKKNPNGVFISKTEELNNNPKAFMKNVSTWIGITNSESLLKPTFAGRRTKGDSVFNTKQTGFDAKALIAERWKNYCSNREASILKSIFHEAYSSIYPNDNYKKVGTLSVFLLTIKPDLEILKYRYNNISKFVTYHLGGGYFISRYLLLKSLYTVNKKKRVEPSFGLLIIANRIKSIIKK